jgi:hypothetical protein
MVRTTMVLIALLAAGSVVADDKAKQEPAKKAEKVAKADGKTAADAKTLAGISILGNQDSPKSLVIVPWKGSEIGDMPGLSRLLDDSIQPVDKDVFMRELSYYEIRAGK